jgi:cytochrome c oxidase subunit 5a
LKFFNEEVDDLFELSRGLNSAFCTDIVPAPEVLAAAMKAGRRLNSFALSARVVEALREKLAGDKTAYEAYLKDLQPTMEELGVPTPEVLGR